MEEEVTNLRSSFFLTRSSPVGCPSQSLRSVTKNPNRLFSRGYVKRGHDFCQGSEYANLLLAQDVNYSICQRPIYIFSGYAHLSLTQLKTNRVATTTIDFPTFPSNSASKTLKYSSTVRLAPSCNKKIIRKPFGR